MLTELGKFLRKIRIDANLYLKNMADALNVSSAFLSSVENGNRKMPESWKDLLPTRLNLSPEEKNAFLEAVEKSSKDISINIENVPEKNRDLALSFARSFPNLDEKMVDRIQKLLDKGGK
ncbi:MAG: helix-turn-helix domain-containing protein [Fibrobacter intestinalis]|uniref:helix-turn-helix domain-containing protein n=1 Tax=Fibrobacter intestinalis TaxID=28122 RepID=UPI003F0CE4D2